MCQEDSRPHKFSYVFRTSITPDAEGISFSKDCKIEIPKDGLVLKHKGQPTAVIPQENVEVVMNDNGAILYMSINGEDAARLLKDFYAKQD